MKSQSFNIDNIYIDSIGVVVGKNEKQGPLGKYFNSYIDDSYFDTKSFEKAQVKLTKASIVKAIKNSKYNLDNIDVCIAGDLSNQIFCSTSAIRQEIFPFIGIYAACATGTLAIILASIYINQSNCENGLVYTSSHPCVSERQFRYPNEYAAINKQTTTKTILGSCSVILSKKENKVKVSKATIGKVVDVLSNNVNDMGSIMAYAAIDTLNIHLVNNNETIQDYDLIVTGDLSTFGSEIFENYLKNKYENQKYKYYDCGKIIYDTKRQNMYSGGSGPACVMCVTFSYFYKLLIKGIYKKILVIATGALHSQISSFQKESIPCIAHAIVLEANE